jgi:hypothetical protein
METKLKQKLPQLPKREPTAIIKQWAWDLPIRAQSTLMTATRDYDGATRDWPGRPIIRAIRALTLISADPRENDPKHPAYDPNAFCSAQFDELDHAFKEFLRGVEPLTVHFYDHLKDACEIIGYKYKKEAKVADAFRRGYEAMCHKLAMNPETEEQMDERHNEDRTKRPKESETNVDPKSHVSIK